MLGAAGGAKMIASLITYPHEVLLKILLAIYLIPHHRLLTLHRTGHSHSSATAARRSNGAAKVYGTVANAATCHQGGRGETPVWRPERTSAESCTERSRYVWVSDFQIDKYAEYSETHC